MHDRATVHKTAMTLQLKRINYSDLNARQQENHNFQKVSAVLADYGFATIRLTDDWQGADFIAQHIDGQTFLLVQLKGRFTLSAKYQEKGLYIAFPDNGTWYLYPHDVLLKQVLAESNMGATQYWQQGRDHTPSSLTRQMLRLLRPYRIISTISPAQSGAA